MEENIRLLRQLESMRNPRVRVLTDRFVLFFRSGFRWCVRSGKGWSSFISQQFILLRVGRDSAVGIATRYGLDGSGIESRWGARFSVPVQTGPGAYPASYTMGTESFPWVKRPGRGADHPPPSKCRGQERARLYLYSPSGPSWPVMGAPLFFSVMYIIDWVTMGILCQNNILWSRGKDFSTKTIN